MEPSMATQPFALRAIWWLRSARHCPCLPRISLVLSPQNWLTEPGEETFEILSQTHQSMKKPFALALVGILWCLHLHASDTWPQWLGPNRNGTLASATVVPASIPSDLKSTWRIQIGGGFSSPVLVGDALVYVDDNLGQETAHCVNARTG